MEVSVRSKVSRQVALRPILFAYGLIAILLGQFGAPILANTTCGLIIPHEHILIGLANTHDLERHLAAEAGCAAGKPDAPEEQASKLQGSRGYVLDAIHLDGPNTTYLTILDHIIANRPTMVAGQHFHPLFSRLEELCLLSQSVSAAPPKPPPKSV